MRIDSLSLSGFRLGWGRALSFLKKRTHRIALSCFHQVFVEKIRTGRTSFLQDAVVFVVVRKAYDTRCSQAVPHPSTILARRCLTAVIGREQVCSSWCGRRQPPNSFCPTQSSSSFSLHSTSVSMPPELALRRNHSTAQIKNIKLLNSH